MVKRTELKATSDHTKHKIIFFFPKILHEMSLFFPLNMSCHQYHSRGQSMIGTRIVFGKKFINHTIAACTHLIYKILPQQFRFTKNKMFLDDVNTMT